MKPSIERKKRYDAPLHAKRKYVKVHLSKELRAKEKKRSEVARMGDKVKVMRGKYKGKEAKVARVDYKKTKVYIEGLSKRTARGREMAVAFQPSNLILTELTDRKIQPVKKIEKTIANEVRGAHGTKSHREEEEIEEKKSGEKTEEKKIEEKKPETKKPELQRDTKPAKKVNKKPKNEMM